MEKNALIARCNEALANEFEREPEDITSDADIRKTLDLDSITLVDMAALIDKEFGIRIANDELAKIKTFGALYEYLIEHGALERTQY